MPGLFLLASGLLSSVVVWSATDVLGLPIGPETSVANHTTTLRDTQELVELRYIAAEARNARVLLLLGGVPEAAVGVTMRPQVTVSPRSGDNVKDLLKTADTPVGYLSPHFPGHVGQLSLGPYTVALLGHNPLLTTLLLNSLISNPALGIGYGSVPHPSHFHAGHLYGRDPLVPLLLRQYGKYLPYGLGSYGLYGYSASNNAEDNRPFGSFKYEYRL